MALDSWPRWLYVWFWIQLVVVTWDASFVLLRPHSFPGGPLSFFYKPFEKYMAVDKVYGDMSVAFGWAQSTMCLIENAILIYAMRVHAREVKAGRSTPGYLNISDQIALLATAMQWGKSIFYWLNDYYGGFSHIKHNSLPDLVFFFIIPNLIWLVGPALVFKHIYSKSLNTFSGKTTKSN